MTKSPMTDEAKAVDIAKRWSIGIPPVKNNPAHKDLEFLARSFLALSEKYRVLKNVAKSGLPNMRCDRWLGHQDNVCPKCVLQYALDELEPGESDG